MTQTATIILTIAIYLVFMVVMGITSRKSVKTLSDFTVGGGNASAWLSALSYGTAYFSAVMFIGYSGTSGWKFGGWAVLVGIGNAIFGSLLAWLVLAKRTRKVARSFEITISLRPSYPIWSALYHKPSASRLHLPSFQKTCKVMHRRIGI